MTNIKKQNENETSSKLELMAVEEVAEMASEAETILSHLRDLTAALTARDAAAIRKALRDLSDETWGYSGGIIGFRPRTDAVYGLLEVIEGNE